MVAIGVEISGKRANAATKRPIPARKMTQEVIKPQKMKVVPIANPAGK
jgi:hypothetical protein